MDAILHVSMTTYRNSLFLIQCVRAVDALCVFVSSSKIIMEWLLKLNGGNACRHCRNRKQL